jgi:peptidoglycan/xylan/chitin deacetylase (PgdA/CDA1 family)
MNLFISLLMILLSLLQTVTASRVFADGAANEDAHPHEVYEQLKAGKRIWTDKTYVKPDQPTVYLTFDDGPSRLTDRVLDILREEGVPATFFMLGEQVDAYPEKVRQVVSEGHAIGNHTYNHKYNELYTNVASFWEQIEQTGKALDEAAGVKTQLIRAPGGTYGNFDAFYFYYLDQAGFEVHDWNIDSGDAKRVGVPANEIIETVKNGPFRDEVIVLMHDSAGHEQTVKALPDIIRLFKAKGYAFAPLNEQVQPVHFSAGKAKWTRSVGPALHNSLLAEAEQHRLARVESGTGKSLVQLNAGGGQELMLAKGVAGGLEESHEVLTDQKRAEEAAGLEGTIVKDVLSGKASARVALAYPDRNGYAGAHAEAPGPLEVILGSGKLLIEPDQYRLTDGHYQVPLRKLLQAMGGKAEWHGSRRTAAVQFGFRGIEYDFSRHEMRVNEGGNRTVYHLPQMELKDGTVYVPLRHTVELLGSRIVSYRADNDRIQVEVALSSSLTVPYGLGS